MSRSQLMATLTQVGDAGVALAEALISILLHLYWPPLCARTNAMPWSAPALPSILHDGVSPTKCQVVHWEHNRPACNCFFGKMARQCTSSGLRAEYEALLVRLFGRTWGPAGAGWTPGAAKQLLK